MSYRILQGDVIDRLRELPDGSVDAIVTDPPYGIRFMGKAWDGKDILEQQRKRAQYKQKSYGFQRSGPRSTKAESAGTYDLSSAANRTFQAWTENWGVEAIRVLKPGGHILCFASTRTYHRMVCGLEDAGFQIRDQIGWVFGSGFPKSHNLSGEWDGWGTALKPAWEPICLARKPFKGTVAKCVSIHGTGALNIAGCRIDGGPTPINRLEEWSGFGQKERPAYTQEINTLGRWPANLIHDGSDEVIAYFPEVKTGIAYKNASGTNQIYGNIKPRETRVLSQNGGDEGSAARFFYCAKASREDRNEGCEHIDERPLSHDGRETPIDNAYQRNSSNSSNSSNSHPTVKPTALMRYLCKLITPPGGTVLDCFMGSGSTGKAALYEGFSFIGIEQSEEYCAIAKARMDFVLETDLPLLRTIEEVSLAQ